MFEKINGLPNSVREKMLQLGLGCSAVVLDVCFSMGVTGKVTVKDVETAFAQAGVIPSTRLIRAGLRGELFTVSKAAASGPGRRPVLYALPALGDLIRRFADDFVGQTDLLLAGDCKSLCAYRAGLHRSFVARAPGQYSRFFLSNRLGLSANASRYYERASGWSVVPRFSFAPVGDVNLLPDRGQPGAVFLLACNSEESMDVAAYGNALLRSAADLPGKRLPPNRFLASWYKRRSYTVYRVVQLCNVYSFVDYGGYASGF